MYQGGELWDLSLVDPDNRRPVDYALRRRLLAQIEVLDAAGVMVRVEEGLPKLWVVHRSLLLRNEHPEWFGKEAAYAPVSVQGPKREHAVVYSRGGSVITVTPRLTMSIDDWQGTSVELPEGQWKNELTGEVVDGGIRMMAEVLQSFPVALLTLTTN